MGLSEAHENLRAKRQLQVAHIPAPDQLADVFTKPLSMLQLTSKFVAGSPLPLLWGCPKHAGMTTCL